MRLLPARTVTAVLTTALCASAALVPGSSLAQAESSARSVVFVVDTSGSMSGSPLTQAKEALNQSINALDPSIAAGLRSYAGSCGDGGRLLVPVTVDNRDAMLAATGGLTAGGGTPTPDALRAAVSDLPPDGDRTIVLISDGQSSCGDPCVVAAELRGSGVDFTVHAVGFNAPETAESELRCIADTTGGQYFSASDASGLASAIGSAIGGGQGLSLTATVTDWPLPKDTGDAAYVLLTVTVRKADGSAAEGATLTTERGPVKPDFTVGPTGQKQLLQIVDDRLDPTMQLRATLGQASASASVTLYDVGAPTVCNVTGKPSQLNPLKQLLDSVGVPNIKPAVDGWIQLFAHGTEFLPDPYRTRIVGQRIDGPGLTPTYNLKVVAVDTRTGQTVHAANLYSRSPKLLSAVTGEGSVPLQAIARKFQCGVLA